jgi:hypothetical protein
MGRVYELLENVPNWRENFKQCTDKMKFLHPELHTIVETRSHVIVDMIGEMMESLRPTKV